MKKFLLSAALVAATIGANAAAFEFEYEGAKVENGGTVTVTKWILDDEDAEKMPTLASRQDGDVNVKNLSGGNLELTFDLTPVEVADGAAIQFCYDINESFIGNCWENHTGNKLTLKADDVFNAQLHYTAPERAAYKSSYTLKVSGAGETQSITIVFDTTGTGAVEGIEVENNVPAEYYNLNGVRVNNPEKGIYIVKRGEKVTKEVVR